MTWRSELDYLKQLAGAGWNGIADAQREMKGPVFAPSPADTIWRPAAVCAGIGMIGGRLTGKRNSTYRVAIGGVIGGILGSTAALAWTSRRFARHATGKAARSVNAVRDQHWLRAHPIDYA